MRTGRLWNRGLRSRRLLEFLRTDRLLFDVLLVLRSRLLDVQRRLLRRGQLCRELQLEAGTDSGSQPQK
jgi:hypothetical protein